MPRFSQATTPTVARRPSPAHATISVETVVPAWSACLRVTGHLETGDLVFVRHRRQTHPVPHAVTGAEPHPEPVRRDAEQLEAEALQQLVVHAAGGRRRCRFDIALLDP